MMASLKGNLLITMLSKENTIFNRSVLCLFPQIRIRDVD
jgi:hypothetical protein